MTPDTTAIVVTVPKPQQDYVLGVKFRFRGRIYWRLPRIPAHPVQRMYFVWDGAVRAWHDVDGLDDDSHEGPIAWLGRAHHLIADPIPMDSFRGYRWFRDVEPRP